MKTTGPDIVGIGTCTVDHLMIVPHMPGDNVNMRAATYLQQPGGLASCSLVAAARLGAKTRLISQIGDDDAGRFIRRDLESEGVDTSLLLQRPGSDSHVSLILVDENTGDRSIITRLPTGRPVSPDEIKREDVTAARVLFVDHNTELTRQAARWAREAGMRVVLDPAQPYAELAELLPWVDVPIVPLQWAQAWMPDQSAGVAAEALYRAGADIAVVTMGECGSMLFWNGGLFHIPAFPVDVVDTTGAGDAFHGGFMAGLLQDWEIPTIARYAAAVGSLNCRALGGRQALPSREEVEALLTRYPDH